MRSGRLIASFGGVGSTAWPMSVTGTMRSGTIESSVEDAATATGLADETLLFAAGALLIGLGLAIVIASSVVYWHNRRQIREQLR